MPTTTIFDTSNIVRSLPYKAVSATVDKSYPGVTVDDNNVSVLYAGELYKDKVNGGTVDSTITKALPLVKFISKK